APEHEIAALKTVEADVPAQPALLHVAVARARNAARGERNLHEAGTVDAEAGLAAPQVGRAEKALGDRHEVALVRVERGQVLRRNEAAGFGDGEPVLLARDGEARPRRQAGARRQ